MKELLDTPISAGLLAVNAVLNPQRALKHILRRLLLKSSQTSFGQRYGLKPNMTSDDFRKTVPISNYSDYRPWIERIEAGEQNVLWPGDPSAFVTTSGTTSTNKLIPITSDFVRYYHLASMLSFYRVLISNPKLLRAKILALGGPSEETQIGTIPVGSITGILYSSLPPIIHSRLAVPPDIYNVKSYSEKLYVFSRLALESPIEAILTVTPGTLLVLTEALNNMAEVLIREIAEGKLRKLSGAPKGIEEQIRSHLKPNVNRARELERSLNCHGKLLPRHIWPISTLCTYTKDGHWLQWTQILQDYGELQIIDPGLVASEGRVSVGLYPGEKYHPVLPISSFVEFLPVDQNCDLSNIRFTDTFLPHELELGRHYTPVLSSFNGLLRYHLEDEVKVVKMKGQIPCIEYIGRLDGSISVAGEKVTEAHIESTIESFRESGVTIDSLWAVAIDWSGCKPRYVFMWETHKPPMNLPLLFDTCLQDKNVSYARKREQQLIHPAIMKAVPVGSLKLRSSKVHWLGQSKQRSFYQEKNDLRDLLCAGDQSNIS